MKKLLSVGLIFVLILSYTMCAFATTTKSNDTLTEDVILKYAKKNGLKVLPKVEAKEGVHVITSLDELKTTIREEKTKPRIIDLGIIEAKNISDIKEYDSKGILSRSSDIVTEYYYSDLNEGLQLRFSVTGKPSYYIKWTNGTGTNRKCWGELTNSDIIENSHLDVRRLTEILKNEASISSDNPEVAVQDYKIKYTNYVLAGIPGTGLALPVEVGHNYVTGTIHHTIEQ